MCNMVVIKVKIYNCFGIMVFFMEVGQVGESWLDNVGFWLVMNGKVVSELIYCNIMDSFEGSLVEVDVFFIYILIIGKDQLIEGVFELYQDVMFFMIQLWYSLWWVMVGVFLVFVVFYLMQYFVVCCVQCIFEEQEGYIKVVCDMLEIQVDVWIE